MNLIKAFFKNWDAIDTFLKAGTRLTHLYQSRYRVIKPLI